MPLQAGAAAGAADGRERARRRAAAQRLLRRQALQHLQRQAVAARRVAREHRDGARRQRHAGHGRLAAQRRVAQRGHGVRVRVRVRVAAGALRLQVRKYAQQTAQGASGTPPSAMPPGAYMP